MTDGKDESGSDGGAKGRIRECALCALYALLGAAAGLIANIAVKAVLR